MVFDRVNAKHEAKRIIREGTPSPVLVTLVYLLLTSGISLLVRFFMADPFTEAIVYIAEGYDPIEVYAYVFGGFSAVVAVFVSMLLSLYNTVMAFGYNGYTLNLARERESGFYDLFDGFGLVVKVILLNILTGIFVFLWGMFFVVPGIMAAYSYSQAVFCLLDDPDISPLEALRRSKAMMRGQKFNFFVVQLSFWGWRLAVELVTDLAAWGVNALVPGVGGTVGSVLSMAFDLWLLPYQYIVYARFYSDLKRREMLENDPWAER